MGTISDKLLYLDGTRAKIKENLNKFGSNITESDTFRSYANKISDIYDKLPKAEKTTSSDTLLNAQNGLVDDFKMYGNSKQGKLPDGYTQVDYIESSGTQYIDTGVNADINLDIKIDMQYTNINASNNDTNFGAIYHDGSIYRRYHTVKNQGKFSWYVLSNVNNIISFDILRHTTYIKASERKMIFDEVEYTLSEITQTNPNINFWLFGRNSNNSSLIFYNSSKLYSCQMYYNNVLVRDFIPCYRNSDNEVGLYDLVNDVFYTNQGTGVFSYGSVAPTPDAPVDIRVVTGTQTINITGKNLFNADTIIPISIGSRTYITYDSTNKSFTFTAQETSSYNYFPVDSGTSYINNIEINVLQNTDYTFSFSRTSNETRIAIYGANSNNGYTRITSFDTSDTLTFNTSTYTEIAVRFDVTASAGTNITFSNLQLELGASKTDYEPYYAPQTYPINLGNMELCKIGTYEDEIYKDNGKWYKKANIGKVILNGSEEYTLQSNIGGLGLTRFRLNSTLDNALNISSREPIVSNYFFNLSNSGGHKKGGGFVASLYLYLYFDYDGVTKSDWTTWLSTHNTTVYYVLATPTITKITDTTLISQLENIAVFTGTNHFTISNSNNALPSIYVKRLKELDKLS